jgi:murein DD-endopeptidase MepM/ murein hydrolase activator NlpD
MHPVTHVIRPHTGVDLAGALGTPVYSIGDGQVSFIGWEGAYGNIVSIQHNDKYSSKYAHLLRFAPNLSKGSRVKRGQLIGYLGQTGNATGPHVHFEVRVYNVPVDPLTVRTPQASAVPPSQIKAFQARAKSLLAGLSYYQKTQMKS